jgi:hypothetical protein
MACKRNKGSAIPPSGLMPSAIAALKAELHGTPAPEGWYTTAEIAAMLGVQFRRAERFCVAKGYPCAKYMTTTGDGKRVPVKHFKVQ